VTRKDSGLRLHESQVPLNDSGLPHNGFYLSLNDSRLPPNAPTPVGYGPGRTGG